MDKLGKAVENLLRRILECPASTPKEMLYLELNCLPIRFIIMSRRLNFLSSIVREDEDSLIFKFLQAQLRSPSKNDWGQTVLSDLELLEIDTSIDNIKSIPVETFRKTINDRIQKEALKYLNNEKMKHSKVLHIEHTKMELQDYLSPTDLSVKEAKFLFMLRCRMADVKANFSGSYSSLCCPLCEVETDTQKHLLSCEALSEENEIVTRVPSYEDLFSIELEAKSVISRVLMKKFKMRKKELKKLKEKN